MKTIDVIFYDGVIEYFVTKLAFYILVKQGFIGFIMMYFFTFVIGTNFLGSIYYFLSKSYVLLNID